MASEKAQQTIAMALHLAVKDYLKVEADFAAGDGTVEEARDFLLQFEVLRRISGAARIVLKETS